jgi:preprotein translocase subunit SecG
VLEKTTWGLAAGIMILCFVCAFLSRNEYNSVHGISNTQVEQTTTDAGAEE